MHGAQENTDHILMPGELESWNVEEGDEMVEEAFDFPTWTSESGGRFLVNVDSFGAVGDGISDDTQVSSCANLKIFMFIWVSVAQRKKILGCFGDSKINCKILDYGKNMVVSL